MNKSIHGSINESPVRCVYRATEWNPTDQPRLFVTEDNKIWIGYGEAPERFGHVGNVGDRNTQGTSRKAILRAANS